MEIDVTALARAEDGETQAVTLASATPAIPDLDLADLTVTGSLSQLGDRMLLAGTLTTTATVTCARCLEPFGLPITARLTEEFAETPSEEQFPLGRDRLDPTPALRSAVLLEIPPRPLHDPACQGLCPVCGKNLNREPHQHDAVKKDHPFAALKDLKTEDEPK